MAAKPPPLPKGGDPMGHLFDAIGQGTILSKPSKTPKPPKLPKAKTGPPFKPPKAPAFKVPKQAVGKPPSRVPPKPPKPPKPLGPSKGILSGGAMLGVVPKMPSWAKPVNPATRGPAKPWPMPYLKPSLQTRQAQAVLKSGGSIVKADKVGQRALKEAQQAYQVQTELWRQKQGGSALSMFNPAVELGGLGKAAGLWAGQGIAGALVGGAYNAAGHHTSSSLMPSPVRTAIGSHAVQAARPLYGAVKTAGQLTMGPDLTAALTGGKFSDKGLALDLAMGLVPLKGLSETARVIEEAGLLGGRELPKVLTGVGERVIPVGEHATVTARRSPYLIPRLFEGAKDWNLARVRAANETLGAGRGLEKGGAKGLQKLSASLAQRHVRELKRWAGHYGNVFDRAEAEALLGAPLKQTEHLAVRSVSQNVMPSVTHQNNLALIEEAKRTLDRVPALRDAAGGNKAKLNDLAATERQARQTVQDLTRENALLPRVERLVHEVPNHQIDRARYPTHPNFAGSKVQLRPELAASTNSVQDIRDSRRLGALHDVWDSLVRVSKQSQDAAIRMGELDPEQAMLRTHQPGRIAHGLADYQLGEDALLSKGHRNARAVVQNLQAHYDASVAKDAERVGKGTVPKQAPGMQADAAGRLRRAQDAYERITGADSKWATMPTTRIQARIDDINNKWNDVVDQIKREVPARKVETAKRNAQAQKRARKGLPPLKTVTQLEQKDAEDRAWQLVNTHPELRHIRDQVAEADALQRILDDRHTARAFGSEGVPSVQTAKEIRQGRKAQRMLPPEFQSTETKKLRGALSLAEDRLTRAEGRASRRLGFDSTSLYGTKSGLVGGEEWNGGTLYYPSKTEAALRAAPKGVYRARGEILPFGTRGEAQKAFTGALMRTGQESPKVTQLVARQALARQSRERALGELSQLRGEAVRGAPPLDQAGQPSKEYIPIRLDQSLPSDVRQEWEASIARLENGHELDDNEAAAVTRGLNGMVSHYLPDPTALHDEAGFGYVHKALANSLRDMRTVTPDEVKRWSQILKGASQVTRDLMIYTKFPGHIPPRFISNVLMGGSDHPIAFTRGLGMVPRLYKNDRQLANWIHHLMGAGATRAYTESGLRGAGKVSKAIQKGSNAVITPIEIAADRGPRIASFLAYASKESGAKNYGDLVRYLKTLRDAKPGDALHTTRRLILEDARKTAGEYENLGPIANKLSSFIFLNRWIMASSRWSARTIARHPIASAAAGVGAYKYLYQPQNPIWNRFNLAGHNIQTALPFTTPIENALQTWGTFGNLKHPPPLGESIGDILNPAIVSALNMAYRRDIETGTAIKSPIGVPFLGPLFGGLEAFGRTTPVGSLVAGKGPFESYRLPRFLLGNYAPVSGAAGPAAGGGSGTPIAPIGPSLSNQRGSITPAQHAAILNRVRAAERRANSPATRQRIAAAERRARAAARR